MPKGYHHLTREKRCQIDVLKKSGLTQKDIATKIEVHPSTITRELKRNSAKRVKTEKIEYEYAEAHKKSQRRRREVSSRPSKLTPKTKTIIIEKLAFQWSPEQISGWLRRNEIMQISHETIYKMIWRDKRKGGNLYKNLRHCRRKYQKRAWTRKQSCIPNRIDIDQRPEIVEHKQRVGDLEVDTIVGKGHVGAVLTIVDRASKLTKLYIVPKKTSENIAKGLVSKLMPIKDFLHTITSDNGGEFAKHEEVSKILGTEFYFSKPYHAWERGLNEHTNGLIRQYIPKSAQMTNFTQEDIDRIEDLLNNRPRKVLDYRTPIEAFEKLSGEAMNIALQS